MRNNYTDITFILDRSRSMEAIRQETISGFNRFLREQKSQAEVGTAKVTLVQFDDRYEVVYSCAPIARARPLEWETFVPRGWTALLDALGKTIDRTGERLEAMNPADRPSKVIMIILTDGEENVSKLYSRERIARMIAHQRERYSWEFIFLGANIDAPSVAMTYNIPVDNAMTYCANPLGAQAAFVSVNNSVLRSRAGASAAFTDDDRNAQMAAADSVLTATPGLLEVNVVMPDSGTQH